MPWTPRRQPKALSHTALGMWEGNRDEFFLKYLAGTRAPKIPQSPPMAVGAAFDAFVKSHLTKDLGLSDPQFELDAIFESQVEVQNRDFGRKAGAHAFSCYVFSGAYHELLDLMQKSTETPQFEFTIERTIDGISFTGKPDLRFKLVCSVIGDWKVRGYCSKSTTSPTKNYRLCRDGYTSEKPSKSNNTAHKSYSPLLHCGLEINSSCLSASSETYADQMTLYGWMMGEAVGDENVAFFMEEIVAKYTGDFSEPLLRIASHRNRVRGDYQRALFQRYRDCWDAIQSGYIFTHLSREESDERCELTDAAAECMSEDDWFSQISRLDTRF